MPHGGQSAVAELVGGREWNEVVNRTPEHLRHLAGHSGHCVELSEADHAAWEAGGSALLTSSTLSGIVAEVRAKVAEPADGGVTEIVSQHCGPDLRRELERFLEAAGG